MGTAMHLDIGLGHEITNEQQALLTDRPARCAHREQPIRSSHVGTPTHLASRESGSTGAYQLLSLSLSRRAMKTLPPSPEGSCQSFCCRSSVNWSIASERC
jgi:hypothetical protein